jgi:dipicolinate synthase subunit A
VVELDLAGLRAAILGGDRRKLEIARKLLSEGCEVRYFGAPPELSEITGASMSASSAEAVTGAKLVFCPMPRIAENGDLYAPFSSSPVRLDPEAMDKMDSGSIVIMGWAPPEMHAAAEARGIHIEEIGQEEECAIFNSIPTAEGALRCAIEHTDETVHNANVLVGGFGRVGETTAHTFLAMGARVFVAARRLAPLARAQEMGCSVLGWDEIDGHWDEMLIALNTVPQVFFNRDRLSRAKPECVYIDLVSPPGSADRTAADELGVQVHWLRGQAATAPRFTGRNQWNLSRERILARFQKGDLS